MTLRNGLSHNGVGGLPDPFTLNALEELTKNSFLARGEFLDKWIDGRRDIDAECNYPRGEFLPIDAYRALYAREAVAIRVVQVWPKECFQVQPIIYEVDEGASGRDDEPTPFEAAFDNLGKSLYGIKSYYNPSGGSPGGNLIWSYLERIDILSGIGTFGVLLMGLDDGKLLEEPADGVEPDGLPSDKPPKKLEPGQTPGPHNLPNQPAKGDDDTYDTGSAVDVEKTTDTKTAQEIADEANAKGENEDEKDSYTDSDTPQAGKRPPQVSNPASPLNGPLPNPSAPNGPMDKQFKPADYLNKSIQGDIRPEQQLSSTMGTDAQYYGTQFTPTSYHGGNPFNPMRPADKETPNFRKVAGGENDDEADKYTDKEDEEYPAEGNNPPGNPKEPARRLLFLRVFDETLVQVVQYEADIRNPRYGQPLMYLITINDPQQPHTGVGLPLASIRVHWSRVIHVADNLRNSEVFGVPRMLPVFNRLLDLRKLYGGSAEMYWAGAFPGLSLETLPQLGGDAVVGQTELEQMMYKYRNGLQRYLSLIGMQAKVLTPTVVDPEAQVNCQIEAICIQLTIPVRVFKGSERGELASSQDDSSWNDRVRSRQQSHITPHIIVPFVDRLIALGVLPTPKEYFIEWPDLDAQTKAQKAAVMLQRTQAYAAYISGQVNTIMNPLDYMTHIDDIEPDVAEEITNDAKKQQEEEQQDAAAMAQQQGFEPMAPEGFQKPVDAQDPVKLKPGEQLVTPPNPNEPGHTAGGKGGGGDNPFGGGAGDNGPPNGPPKKPMPPKPTGNTLNYDPNEERDKAGKWTSGSKEHLPDLETPANLTDKKRKALHKSLQSEHGITIDAARMIAAAHSEKGVPIDAAVRLAKAASKVSKSYDVDNLHALEAATYLVGGETLGEEYDKRRAAVLHEAGFKEKGDSDTPTIEKEPWQKTKAEYAKWWEEGLNPTDKLRAKRADKNIEAATEKLQSMQTKWGKLRALQQSASGNEGETLSRQLDSLSSDMEKQRSRIRISRHDRGQVQGADMMHRAGVEMAIRQGHKVPAEVLADYPDLMTGNAAMQYDVLGNPVDNAFDPSEARDKSGKWTIGSKVVDEDNRPLKVYHGTFANFDEFRESNDLGFHFGTREQAEFRIKGSGDTKRLLSGYLSIKNPIEMPDHVWDTPNTLVSYFEKHNLPLGNVKRHTEEYNSAIRKLKDPAIEDLPLAEYRKLKRELTEKRNEAKSSVMMEARKELQKAGYDGVKYKNDIEGEGYSWIAFNPSQINIQESKQVDNAFCPTGEGGGVDDSCGSGESTLSPDDVMERIKASPQFHGKEVNWEKYRERYKIMGEFHYGKVDPEVLKKLINSQWLSLVQAKNIDETEVAKKQKTGKFNPVIITERSGGQMLVVDGNHSLVAAIRSGKDVNVIVPKSRMKDFGLEQPTQNAFCATGQGGGKDNSCGHVVDAVKKHGGAFNHAPLVKVREHLTEKGLTSREQQDTAIRSARIGGHVGATASEGRSLKSMTPMEKRKHLEAGIQEAGNLLTHLHLKENTNNAFDPQERRDEKGQWTTGGSGGGQLAPTNYHRNLADKITEHAKSGRMDNAAKVWKGIPQRGQEVISSLLSPEVRQQLAEPTPKSTDTPTAKPVEPYWRTHTSLKVFGDKLDVKDLDSPTVRKHIAHLAAVPEHIHTQLLEKGLSGVFIGNASVPDLDDMQYLKGVTPRGWPEHLTWDIVAGGYNNLSRAVMAGVGDSGCVSLMLHEYGHAVGGLLELDNSPELKQIHKEIYDKLDPYLQQDGPGGKVGCQELFAEGFGTRVISRDRAIKNYGQKFVTWLEKETGIGDKELWKPKG